MDSPYMDFEDFNLRQGSTVGVKTVGGKLFYGTLKSIDTDEATGSVQMVVDPDSVIEVCCAELGSTGVCTLEAEHPGDHLNRITNTTWPRV